MIVNYGIFSMIMELRCGPDYTKSMRRKGHGILGEKQAGKCMECPRQSWKDKNVGCHLDVRQGTRNASDENRGVLYINDAFCWLRKQWFSHIGSLYEAIWIWSIKEQDILFHRGNGVHDCKLYINDKKKVDDLCTLVEKLLKIGKHKIRTQLRMNWQWMIVNCIMLEMAEWKLIQVAHSDKKLFARRSYFFPNIVFSWDPELLPWGLFQLAIIVPWINLVGYHA